jgi:hypothetical protein
VISASRTNRLVEFEEGLSPVLEQLDIRNDLDVAALACDHPREQLVSEADETTTGGQFYRRGP